MGYFQGFLVPVPQDKKEAYRAMAADAVPYFEKYGMVRMVESWGVDVPHGEVTDMYRGIKAEEGENVVFSWVDWGTKEVCEKAHAAMMEDKDMEMPGEMPFDGMRMAFAGFELLGEKGKGGRSGYVQGYLAPAPVGNRAAVETMTAAMRDIAIDAGALRAVDGWAEDIADGKVTDLKMPVAAKDGEAVVFGFHEWADQAAYEAGSAKMREDERMAQFAAEMPVDGKRMVFGGFEVLLDTAQEG